MQYVLTTSIWTFQSRKPLDFNFITQTKEKIFKFDWLTERGMESVIELNLEEVDLLWYYTIDDTVVEEKED